MRVVGDRNVLWGTPEFLREPKLDGGAVIDRGEIHYREYPAWMVKDLLAEVGYAVTHARYVPVGKARSQRLVKRCVKRVLTLTGLAGMRLFASGYLVCAKRPA